MGWSDSHMVNEAVQFHEVCTQFVSPSLRNKYKSEARGGGRGGACSRFIKYLRDKVLV